MLAELLAHPGVVEDVRLGSPIGVMALHGGIEEATSELAAEVAVATGASLYAVTQPDDLAWHIPSIKYHPDHSDGLRSFLDHVRIAISLHGFGRADLPRTILVGGANRSAAAVVAAGLRHHTQANVVEEIEAIPKQLRGFHPANPVNLPTDGGVQLEMSAAVRSEPIRSAVLAALARVLPQLEASFAG